MQRTVLTRQQLYDLAWSKPMTQISKDFGMSDVGLRKIYVNHQIPTPPVGHWSKVAHGKAVKQLQLPITHRAGEELVYFTPRAPDITSEEELEATLEAEQKKALFAQLGRVPEVLPKKIHPLSRTLRAALRKTKRDKSDFLTLGDSYRPEIRIGRSSIDRGVRILDTLFQACNALGYKLERDQHGIRLAVGEEPFQLRLYEIEQEQPHVPTTQELKQQKERERLRQQYPGWYKSNRKAYRRWDRLPSGRLMLELRNVGRYHWDRETPMRRWRDRKTTRLESLLPDVLMALGPMSVRARELRVAREEAAARKVEAERQREARRKRRNEAEKLGAYLDELAATCDQAQRLERLLDHLKLGGHDARLVGELNAYIDVVRVRLASSTVASDLQESAIRLGDERLVTALLEPKETDRYG